MGLHQKPGDLLSLVSSCLGLESSCIRVCGESESRVGCLVHESWLLGILSGTIPSNENNVYPASDYERQLLLQPSHSGPIQPWFRVCIKVVNKSAAKSFCFSSDVPGPTALDEASTVSDLLHDIGHEAHQSCWDNALRSYPLAMTYLPQAYWGKKAERDTIEALVEDVFGLHLISLKTNQQGQAAMTSFDDLMKNEQETNTFIASATPHSNMVPLVCAIESDEAYFLVEPFYPYGLHDIFTFSPAIVAHSTARLLFVIYQVLHSLCWYHEHNVTFGKLTVENIRIGKGLFLYLSTPSLNLNNLLALSTSAKATECKMLSSNEYNIKEGENDTRRNIDSTDTTNVMPSINLQLLSPQGTTVINALSDPNIFKYDLPTLVAMWVRDEVTNYDYLMALNYFAGRRLGDPNHHPMFPWVTDFSEEERGFRDLSKSKFRLNKGDHLLDTMYKQSWFESHEGGNSDTVPHHVSDVLSEITFHAYMARRTPVTVLCQHLRSYWVPNEYPASMQRLYEWTPDECIPQFFSDPTIFTSMHTDLPDLALPSWTSRPDDFITWHREVLECEEVSKHLHQWIDLTFGYKLAGKAAIKAKNVCLDLVNKRQSVSNYGVVQLFSQPHPPQSSFSTLLESAPLRFAPLYRQTDNTSIIPDSNLLLKHLKPCLDDSLISLDSIEDGSQDSDVIHTKRDNGNESHSRDTLRDTLPLVNTLSALIASKENSTNDTDGRISESEMIHLPDECNPLDLLDKYEIIQKFKRQFNTTNESRDHTEQRRVLTRDALLKGLMKRDMEALGCLIVEIVLTEKVRLLTAGLSPEAKTQTIRDLVTANPKVLPRFIRNGVLSLLREDSKYRSMWDSCFQDNDEDQGEDTLLPPLSARLLLHPQTGLFPFPEYFHELRTFLVEFNQARLPSMTGTIPSQFITDGLRHCYTSDSCYSTSQVDVSLARLPSLLPKLDDEGFRLLLYHVEPLFTSEETSLYAFLHLFDILAHAMGPKKTIKTFMKPLEKLCDSRSLENYEHIASQSFLSQIIVRFGLENFLSSFVGFVIDAVAFELMLQKTSQGPDQGSVQSTEELTINDNEIRKTLKSQEQMYISVDEDDDPIGESSAAFSDQEETDDFTMHVDDVDDVPADDVIDYVRKPVDEQGDVELDQSSGTENVRTLREQDSTESAEANRYSKEFGYTTAEDDFADKGDIKVKNAATKKVLFSRGVDEEKDVDESNECPEISCEAEHDIASPLPDNESASTGMLSFPESTVQSEVTSSKESSIIHKKKSDESVIEVEENGDMVSDAIQRFEADQDFEDAEVASSSGTESDDEISDGNHEDNGESGEELDPEGRGTTYGFYQDTGYTSEEAEVERVGTDLTSTYISGIAAESVMWLAPRLGPVLTSKHLTHELLQMLPQCYTDVLGAEEYEHEDEDRKAKWVLYCLGSFCILYGEAFVLQQYLPFIQRIVNTVQSRFSARGEASLAAVLALLKYCIPYMSKETLVDNFEILLKTSFQPVLRILSSWNTKFPGGGDARAALCHSYVDLLTVLSSKLERELARELMTAPLQQFFSCFELVHLKKKVSNEDSSSDATSTEETNEECTKDEHEGDITRPDQIEAFYKTTKYEELCSTFSPAMAHHAYVPLCGIMGSKYMESALYNHDLIWNLCCSHDAQLSHPAFEETELYDDAIHGEKDITREGEENGSKESEETTAEQKNDTDKKKKSGKSPRRGSKPRIPSWLRRTDKSKEPDTVSVASMGKSSSDQYLRGNWLEHWKYQLHSKSSRERGSQFHLQKVKLQTFTGHSGSVRSIYVQDSEHFFLSASKDKTVKLWSLSNHGGGHAQSASSCTYYHHTRGVFAVDMVESVRQAASADGTVHIWDPVTVNTIDILELPRGNSVVAMASMPAPSQSVVVATSEGTARFIDVRQCQFVQEWKTTTSSVAGTIRDICCSTDGRWVAVGFSSGLVSVLDVRGGLLRSQRRAHTSDILQVRAFNTNSLVTSSVDQGLSMWKDDGLRLRNFKGHTDPLHLITVLKDDVISASTANRIGLHVSRDDLDEMPYTSYKLPPDVFRGNITSMGYLPLNRLLLLGSDTGNITLCA